MARDEEHTEDMGIWKEDIHGRSTHESTGAQPTIEFERGKGIEDFKAQMRSGFARPNP